MERGDNVKRFLGGFGRGAGVQGCSVVKWWSGVVVEWFRGLGGAGV